MIKGWHGWVGTFTGVVLVTAALLPLAVLAVWALARRRSVTGTTPARAWRMSLAEVGIVGLAALASHRWWRVPEPATVRRR